MFKNKHVLKNKKKFAVNNQSKFTNNGYSTNESYKIPKILSFKRKVNNKTFKNSRELELKSNLNPTIL